jgi:hypothetical protein
MSSNQIDEEAVAAADKEMEERANRAKDLLSQRYKGLKTQQVRLEFLRFNDVRKRQDSSTHHSVHSIFVVIITTILVSDRKVVITERCSWNDT